MKFQHSPTPWLEVIGPIGGFVGLQDAKGEILATLGKSVSCSDRRVLRLAGEAVETLADITAIALASHEVAQGKHDPRGCATCTRISEAFYLLFKAGAEADDRLDEEIIDDDF